MAQNEIVIRQARLHNLKNVDVRIPKGRLVVVTGVSGSGKSSLVLDILFEQGRRLYLQSIGMIPAVAQDDAFDEIRGIGPTVAVQQGVIRQGNPRSVVGTRTRILNYLGALYAHEGRMACPACGASVGQDMVCGQCGRTAERLTAGYFSFNSPRGMCLACEGRGVHFELVLEKLLPHPDTTMRQLYANAGSLSSFQYLLNGRLKPYADRPFAEAPAEMQEHALYGVPLRSPFRSHSHSLFDHLRHRLAGGEDIGGTIRMEDCPECQGSRVGPEARRVTLNGRHIGHLGHLTVAELGSFLEDLADSTLSSYGRNLAREILRQVHGLLHVGLGHLALYRPLPTLSGGELQRLFLACHLESGLESLVYILDEPTIGLHEVEKRELIEQLQALKALGNSVVVVEHDRNVIESADYILDLGPLAGVQGGQVVYQGDYAGLLATEGSITGQYLTGRRTVLRKARSDYAAVTAATPRLALAHVRTNNLQDVTVSFPLGMLVGVAGVSGSGKSSLVADTLAPLLRRHFARADDQGGEVEEEDEVVAPRLVADRLEGAGQLAGYAEVSQRPIGRHHNSSPVSYLGVWDQIRKLFAGQPEAVRRGYTPGHFSFNAAGACPECQGSGQNRLWLGGYFFATSPCPACQGRRYQAEVLQVTWQGYSILDVLQMSVSEAVELFATLLPIQSPLQTLESIGMGYITLGQPASTISGGEAQRIKLARELSRRRRGRFLYLLDEPTTGLSFYDIDRLLLLLDRLVKQGHSIIVVEHDPSVLSYCDWIVELGPGGGAAGGRVIAEGAPAGLKEDPRSRIGPFLQVET